MRRASLTAIIAAAAILSGPSLALAKDARVGVLPLEVEGTLPPNGNEQLSAEIEREVSAAGATLVPASELATAGAAASCRDEACLRTLATEVSATHLVRPSVRLDQSDYVITLAVIEGATGTVVHQAEEVCELCGLSEAVAVAGTLAASLQDRLTPEEAPATLTVTSTPAGSQVLLDGELVGVTPLELSIPPGAHVVVLRREGYVDGEHRFSVPAGGTASVDLEIVPRANEGEGRKPLPPFVRPLGWAAVGVGAATLASGIALLAIDERPVEFTRCEGPDVDADGNCRFRHKTLAGGVMMTVVGVVGITAGALLLVRSRKGPAPDQRRARLRPNARGLALHF